MATVASTSPPVLMAHLGASTSSIRHRLRRRDAAQPRPARRRRAVRHARGAAPRARRPRHRPCARAPTRRRPPPCGAPPNLGAEDFPRDLLDLMGLLGDERVEHGAWSRFRATPGGHVEPADRAPRLERLLGPGRRAARPRVRLRPPLRHRRRAAGVRAVPGIVPPVGRARRAVHDRHRRRARRRRPRAGRVPRRPGPAGDPRHPHQPPHAAAAARRGGRAPRHRRSPARCRRPASSTTAPNAVRRLFELAERDRRRPS